MDSNQLLLHAIEALHDGNRVIAGVALARLVRRDPANLYAWLWLSRAVDEPDRQRYCIQRMLDINPSSEDAREELALIQRRTSSTLSAPKPASALDGDLSVHLYVADIPRAGRADVVRRLHLRQPILLRREPNHPEDRNAVRLETASGEVFGFVPREAARLLAPYMDRHMPVLNGVVNELFTSSRGEHMRAGITLFLPAEEAELHAALDMLQNAKVEIAYWFENSDDAIDLMLDCTEDIFREIREWLGQYGLDIITYGTPFHFASDGCNYRWYVHLSSAQANSQQIKKHLERHYRIRPTASELAELNMLFDISDSESERKTSELRAATDKIGWLNQELERLRTISVERRGVTLEMLFPAVREYIANRLDPEQILHLLAHLFPNELVVLDSAYDSAREIERFRNSRRAFELLWRLATEYPALMRSGNGHRASCDDLFGGDAYAAQDHDSSDYCRRARTFHYAGKAIYMPEHLKIGKSFDPNETLRIHFKWLNDEGKVAIGHCGKHLPQQA